MTVTIAAPTAAAYDLLRNDAGFTDRSDRLRLSFSGAQAAATLTGLFTNDVIALQPGHGHYAAALTPKGKVIADLRVFHRVSGGFVVDTSAAAAGFFAMIRKYVNPRLARYEEISATMLCLGVVGPHARQVVAHALGCSPAIFDLLPPYANCDVPYAGDTVMVARAADYGVDGFDCFVNAPAAPMLREALIASGAPPADSAALDCLRIEAGRPAWGVDMTEETLVQEATLDALDAISYTKGCYTGQEVVARVHFKGHVNRLLRGLRLERMPAGEARLFSGDADVGDVRSRALSPRLGAIALAMVRREIEPGTDVAVRGDHGEMTATVTALPFPA